MKILIVDDSSDDRRLLRYMVTINGHEAIEAEDGAEGLEKAKSTAPDLIISDALMPVMDGFQFLREVKQDPALHLIPFIFYSSSYQEYQDVRLAMALGADSYVIKPVEPAVLWGKIEPLLRAGKLERTPIVPLIGEDAEYLKRYSQVVATKLEEKVRELEKALAERDRAEKQLQQSLEEKTVMLKEIHHRVRNNMQVIYSLLNLQAKGIADRTVRALFEESRDRVHSMALIHEKLYQSKDMAQIEFKGYLQNLVQSIANTYKQHDIHVSVEMEPLALDVNAGVPCGLIVNELVSNGLKHAFPDGKVGTIRVGINKNSEGENVLTVADNGIGFPEKVDFRNTTSLGLQIVNVLTGQLQGNIELSKTEGTRFSITFAGVRKNNS
jgi:two-component sensor histidine kinase